MNQNAVIHLFFGEDEYPATEAARRLNHTLLPEAEQALGLEILDGRAGGEDEAVVILDRCRMALQTVGLFGGKKVVWLRDTTLLMDGMAGRPEAVKAKLKDLHELIDKKLPPGHSFVITAPKVDKRSSFYKACAEIGEVREFTMPEKTAAAEKQARERAQEEFRAAEVTLGEEALELFLQRVGTDSRQIVNEVAKLTAYLGDRRQARPEDIRMIVSASRNVLAWDLADAFGQRDLAAALKHVRQLLFQKESPVRLIITIEGRLRDLLLYREALDKAWLKIKGTWTEWSVLPPEAEKIFTEAMERDPRKTHPFRAGLLAKQATNYSPRELQRAQRLVLTASERLVSGGMSQQLVLELLLMRVMRRDSLRAARGFG